MADQLSIPADAAALLEPYLPPKRSLSVPSSSTRASNDDVHHGSSKSKPFVTLTFATSLDSQLSLAPGVRTTLSGPASKAMTHHLRTRHSAILIGVATLLADDPGLNSRVVGAGIDSQPRPVVLDPTCRWTPSEDDKVLRLARDGLGRAPFVVTAMDPSDIPKAAAEVLERFGGRYISIASRSMTENGRQTFKFDWQDVFTVLRDQGHSSVMVEGGGTVINSLLEPKNNHLVDSVIVTIAPTWLGQGGVVVSPPRVHGGNGVPSSAARLSQVKWHPYGDDVVLCGKFRE